MRIRSWIALITYVASLIGLAASTAIGPWSWWVNLLVIGTPWALMFPRRDAHRQGYTLRSYVKTSSVGELALLVALSVALSAAWPIAVPSMWIFVQGGAFGDRPEKDTVAP